MVDWSVWYFLYLYNEQKLFLFIYYIFILSTYIKFDYRLIKKPLNNAYIVVCIIFEKTNWKSFIGEWLERPTDVPRVACAIPISSKNF